MKLAATYTCRRVLEKSAPGSLGATFRPKVNNQWVSEKGYMVPILVCIYGGGDQTQGLVHVRDALYK